MHHFLYISNHYNFFIIILIDEYVEYIVTRIIKKYFIINIEPQNEIIMYLTKKDAYFHYKTLKTVVYMSLRKLEEVMVSNIQRASFFHYKTLKALIYMSNVLCI